jgi:hypothetical protein
VLYTSTAMDGTDNTLGNGSEDDENLRTECEDEGRDCDDGDSDSES